MITFGSLFSGIGGIDLGLERAGLKCVWQSEIDPYACRVLAKHWPDIPNLGDIRGIDWTTVDRADLVAGGYPCQPFSIAGRRAGADDPDNLWPYFAECLRVLRPRYALLENVPNHLSLGFGPVLGDLAALGYDTEWDCLPAAAVGAPHLRDRLFAIARHAGPNTDGLWPTATTHDQTTLYQQGGMPLGLAVRLTDPNPGHLNPTWVEWLMGFPIGWTASEPSATPSSHK